MVISTSTPISCGMLFRTTSSEEHGELQYKKVRKQVMDAMGAYSQNAFSEEKLNLFTMPA